MPIELPEDIGRLIFEMLAVPVTELDNHRTWPAYTGKEVEVQKKYILTFPLVSRRVREWVEPALYRHIRISNRATFEKFLQPGRQRPSLETLDIADFNASFIVYHEKKWMNVLSLIPQLFPNMSSFALQEMPHDTSGTYYPRNDSDDDVEEDEDDEDSEEEEEDNDEEEYVWDEFDTEDFCSQLAELPLEELYLVYPLSLARSFSNISSPPIFHSLTHLYFEQFFYSDEDRIELHSKIPKQSFPVLTHVAFEICSSRTEPLHTIDVTKFWLSFPRMEMVLIRYHCDLAHPYNRASHRFAEYLRDHPKEADARVSTVAMQCERLTCPPQPSKFLLMREAWEDGEADIERRRKWAMAKKQ